MPYRIYDRENEEWLAITYYDFDAVEDYVMNELGDFDFERYSIYQRICG